MVYNSEKVRTVEKQELYKRIKIAGIISYIPVILATGPLGGYFLGNFLEKKLGLGSYVSIAAIGIGVVVSISEVIRAIRLAYRIDRKS